MSYAVGIVGAEAAKFTPQTEALAREAIRRVLVDRQATKVISGGCHLGGIDTWAIEEGSTILGLDYEIWAPKHLRWAPGGYKARNMIIAERSDEVVCIVVREYPPTYAGMTFPSCYHCNTEDHVKSGGCWTMHRARHLHKPGRLIII
jgi:hypothetical protein